MSLGKDIQSEVNKLAAARSKEITPDEIFHSKQFAEYTQNIVDSITHRFGEKAIKVDLFDAGPKGFTANTDGNHIKVNVGNELAVSYTELLPRFNATMGFVFHESAHCIYMNFDEEKLAGDYIAGGFLYGEPPVVTSAEDAANLKELEEYVQNQQFAPVFQKLYHEMGNIIADAHDEASLCRDFSSYIRNALTALVEMLRSTNMLPLEVMIQDEDQDDLSIMYSVALQMARFDEVLVRDPSSEECKKYLDMTERMREPMRIARETDNPKVKYSQINQMLLILWPFIKDKIQDAQQSQGNGQSGNGGGQGQNNENADDNQSQNTEQNNSQSDNSSEQSQNTQSDTPGQMSEQDIKDIVDAIMNSLSNGEKNSGSTSEPKNHESSDTSKKRTLQSRSQDPSSDQSNQDSSMPQPTQPDSHENAAGKKPDFTNDESTKVLERIVKSLSHEWADEHVDEELASDLRNEVYMIDQNDNHKGVPLYVERKIRVSSEDIYKYDTIMAPLKPYSRRLQKAILETLRDMRDGETLRQRLYGNHFEATEVYRPDHKFFSNEKQPQEWPDMAVAILVDHSYSVNGDRIANEMKAAMLLHDFCCGLGIPVHVAGHRTSDKTCRYIIYTDYSSDAKRDRYRLAQMDASGANRDGMAIEIALNLLSKRSEDIKLLFIISDGKPNHRPGIIDGKDRTYGGDGAAQDIKSIVRKYRRQNIETIACAIGTDKDYIHSIYGDGFLDIAHLETLPKKLVNIVRKRLM